MLDDGENHFKNIIHKFIPPAGGKQKYFCQYYYAALMTFFKLHILLSLLLIIILNACSSAPRFTSRYKEFSSGKTKPYDLSSYKNAEALQTVIGVASYYADEFHGKITYGGEIYDMYKFSAAHPNYQMGTIVRVTNLSNGKKIIIRINDKMPFRPDRIIDLSYGTAEELDMIQAGITEVKVEVLEWGTGKK